MDGTPGDAAYTLHRRRIYILPTPFGLGFAAALVVMLVGAINYNNSLAYVLVFLLASTALMSMLHAYRNLAGLTARPGGAQPVFPGETCRYTLCLENPQPLTRPALELVWGGVRRRWRRRERRRLPCAVPGLGTRCSELTATARARGWRPLGRVTLETRYPLGLFRAWAPLGVELRCLVYPRAAGDQPLPGAGGAPRHDGVSGRTGEDDFGGLRPYVPGDPPRRMDWKGLARTQTPQVKLFTGGAPGQLVLRWEDTAGPVEARLSQLARWVLDAERRDLHYALEAPGTSLPPDRGPEHLHRCLRALALHGEGAA